MKRVIEIVMAVAIVSLSLALVNPVKAHVFLSEFWGEASTTTHWGFPLELKGEYTTHVLKLGVRGVDLASATARGNMYVWGIATETGWVIGTLKWYMNGTLVAPFIGKLGVTCDAWITVKFQAYDDITGALVEKVVLHEHADPITGTQFDGEYSGTMNIPLYYLHLYKFTFDVEVHAEVAALIGGATADFGGVFWSDSRIEWRFMDIPNVRLPGGGGCPTLFVWNGMDYAEEAVLNIHAESDITVQHEIQNTLALDEGFYKLQLRELDNFTSHIDQVKLYAVNGEEEWHLCPLTHVYHSELGRVTWKLRLDDSKRVDLEPTEIIDLKFLPSIPYGETAYLIFEINGYNMKVP